MASFNIRRLSKRLSTSITFVFLLSIAAAVLAEFFIELAKERGAYNTPTARLNAAMTAFSEFVTQTWFLVTAAFFAGLTAGLWVDPILRRREAASMQQELALTIPVGQPGTLDYIVEGLQSFTDITEIFQSVSKDTTKIQRSLVRYQRLFVLFQDFSKRRTLAAKLAAKLNKFSGNTGRYVPQIADARQRTYVNCLAVIEGANIATHDDLNALVQFVGVLGKMMRSSAGAADAIDQARDSVNFITGISREMNAAADLFSNTMAELCSEVRAYSAICEQLLTAASTKAQLANEALASQASVS